MEEGFTSNRSEMFQKLVVIWKVLRKMTHPINRTRPDNAGHAATWKREDGDGQFPGGKYLTDAGWAWKSRPIAELRIPTKTIR